MWAGRAAALSARLARPAFAALPVLSLRCAASKTVATPPVRDRVSKDVAEYWEQVLKTVDKATASKLIAHLDVTQVLGLPPPAEADATAGSDGEVPAAAAAARRRGVGSRKGRPPLYSYYVKVKKQHPKAVALVRVGEFYEAVGIDAVLLVQHAGLNPMGSGVPPRAGCPKQNLRRTVEDLVNAGLSVAVCEEAPENYSYGLAHKKQKDRYIAQVVTPASPHLLHGLVDEETDLLFDAAPPLLALVPQVGGYTVLEVSVDLGTVTVMEGLTEDAVYARLHEGGLAPPLFLHVPPTASGSGDRRLSEGTFEREWEQRVAAVFRSQVGVVERYSDPDWLEGLLTRVRSMLGLDASTHFNVIRASTRDRPRPLYYCTALNLGLHKARGQPCLLDYLLPQGSQLPLRRWMRRLLLLPPGPATAVALHRVCEILAGLSESLPLFPHVPAASVVLKLRNREANDIFFREMGELCAAIQDLLTRSGPQLPQLADSLLEVACQETGVKLGRERVLAGCRTALAAIHEVVDHDTQLVAGEWLPALEALGEDEREAMHKLMQSNEGAFRGKVRESVMQQHCDAVLQAREWVQRELQAVFQPLLRAHEQAKAAGREKAKDRPYIIYDAVNNALWLRWPKDSAAAAEGKVMDLPHPRDRNGKVESSCYSSHGLESALDDYRRACDEAGKAVRAQLRKLAGDLQGVQTELVCAATMGVAAAALDAHTREALRRGWKLPVQGFTAEGPPSPAAGGEPEGFEITDMWPYWLDGWDPSSVHNSLSLDGMALLTGPNMAGKSTILRSVCAVALLGACGLYAPAGSARVPYFDAFMLRNFSSDSPLEGRSAFAVEMTEMRYVLEDVSQRSLVLVDELGKGTEVRAGASLAGALMEELDRSGCRGIFATHLHALLDLDLELSNTDFYMMETAAAEDEQEAAAALDGYFYAGSTEAIGDRLKSHRQRTGKGGPHMEMAFLSLGSSQGAASLARSVESAVIRELQRRGFPMLSATDARRRHVARASGVAASAGDN
ncbi:mitochondrial-targeted muts 1 [Chlorella sorokiniana]|uniref:Mitochondrial-targeted muts 1 n=1 Tax=Chlorella sorokiniana TaxID=3076 RepID=A0A2P6TJ72_CHLSO|nr:mitochondrial-targeted muts 1 [Chlorella sorokiniana]|eukprot:PRW39283.1 mitochondrial-targeted muts 1 [Chlorella sorokiniana]